MAEPGNLRLQSLDEPQEWLVVWEAGCVLCLQPSFDAVTGRVVPKGQKLKVTDLWLPPGSTPSLEMWGLVAFPDGQALWAALTYNQQQRAEFIEPEIKNEIHLQCVLKDGRWKMSLYGFHKNNPFIFEW